MDDLVKVSGFEDPDGEAPWVMQLVSLVDKVSPPDHSAVCEAAAMAVVSLLADERAQPGGEWSPAVQRWLAGRIRKHVRRARGAAWDHAQDLAGVTVSHAGAQVRAFVPMSTTALPKEISKLQMQGFALADPHVARDVTLVPLGPVVVSICPVPVLPTGKAAAAAGHAAQLAARDMVESRLAMWAHGGFPVVVEHPPMSAWAILVSTSQVVVVDAGFTEVAPGTCTALARWA